MTTKTLAAAALAATMLSTVAAHANIVTVATSGYWQASQGVNDYGTNMCMVTTFIGDGMIAISVGGSDQRLTVGAYKETWNIPVGLTMPMAIQIDGHPLWASTNPQNPNDAQGNEKSIWMRIAPGFTREAVHQLTAGTTIRLYFSGSEPSWTASLSGTTGVWPAFMRCVQQVAPEVVALLSPNPTQPFVPDGPAQPFANSPATPPTQPFTRL